MFYPKLSRIINTIILVLLATNSVADDTDSDYQTIQWNDLLTKKDITALMNPPDELFDIADGSEEDKLSNAFTNALNLATDNEYQRALSSTIVREEFNNKKIRIAGFIVPITVDSSQNITEFFLVPYYGACIHVPPPPPNQIIFSQIDQPLQLDDISNPFWAEGTFSTKLIENKIATSAYSMKVEHMELYEEE